METLRKFSKKDIIIGGLNQGRSLLCYSTEAGGWGLAEALLGGLGAIAPHKRF
jgi:hypothetical protein